MISIDSGIFTILFTLLFIFGIISVIPNGAWIRLWSYMEQKDN